MCARRDSNWTQARKTKVRPERSVPASKGSKPGAEPERMQIFL